MEDFQEVNLEENSPKRSHSRFIWLILIGLGFLVYELTAQPALGVSLASIKFGWNDLLSARWFRRTDPDRRRGRTYFWLYLASSFWKIAITATILMFATVFVHF